MNRKERRAQNTINKRAMRKDWADFIDLTKETKALHNKHYGDDKYNFHKAWRNNKYVVQAKFGVLRGAEKFVNVFITRVDNKPIYSWKDLYRIKNELFGNDVEAFNYFPRVGELVCDTNLFWFIIKESELDFKLMDNGEIEFPLKKVEGNDGKA